MTNDPRTRYNTLQQGNREILNMNAVRVNDKRTARAHLLRVMTVMYPHEAGWFVADQEHGGLDGAHLLFMQIAALY